METNNSIKNNWPIIKSGLKEKYPQLSENNITYIDGYENEFLHNLELKLGMNRIQLTTILYSLIPIESMQKI